MTLRSLCPAVAALACTTVACGGSSGAGDPSGGGAAPDASSSSSDPTSSDATGTGTGGGPRSEIVPLFGEGGELEPPVLEETETALVTRFSDRARDRHAREDQFQAYEHYLHLYWEHRTAQVEITDTVAKGGSTIVFDVETLWKLDDKQAELRFFFRGVNTVAEYHDNAPMTAIDDLHYTRTLDHNFAENRELQVGDKIEFELSQFLDSPPQGRDNYYGTTYLYIVGKGLVPWQGTGALRDSEEIPEVAWLGGRTTLHRNESAEPESLFMQLATNMAPQNGQKFVLGRRVLHTSFVDGSHDESPENPMWAEQADKAGPFFINSACNACHARNGRALAPQAGVPLDQYVFRVGDADGKDDPDVGHVLQVADSSGTGEGSVSIAQWIEADGLRRPEYAFEGKTPSHHSARISPQLVGMGLLEAIPEADVLALADPDDADGDGISGRARVVVDVVTGDKRLGRFGWKAVQPRVQHQVAAALRTDMGVLTSVYPTPDCGTAQSGCGASEVELEDGDLDHLTRYISLLGVHARRNHDAPEVLAGADLFATVGCASCHHPTFVTSDLSTFAEVRSQTIHPYTDLLLHDMGPGLADNLEEDGASGAEWRTPPLWGLGLTAGVSGGEGYLHDGRARTVSEAILWHGGEGEKSKAAFAALSADDKDALLAFLLSL